MNTLDSEFQTFKNSRRVLNSPNNVKFGHHFKNLPVGKPERGALIIGNMRALRSVCAE